MATGGGVTSREGLRYAEYLPPSAQRSDADIDHTAGRRLLAVGLGVAAVAFAGRYAFQIWKPLEQVITATARKISSPSFSSYYKGGFEQKMSKREASLILGVRFSHRFLTKLDTPYGVLRLLVERLQKATLLGHTFPTGPVLALGLILALREHAGSLQ